MSILVMTGYYPPPFNANAIRAYYLVKALRARNHRVVVMPLLASWHGIRKGDFREEIISIRKFSGGTLIKRIMDVLSKERGLSRLSDMCSRYEFQAIVATLPPVEAIPIAYGISRKCGVTLIADIQDLADEYRIMERPLLSPLIRLYFRKVYQGISAASLVSVTTEYIADVIRERTNNGNVIIVPNGADVSIFNKCFELRKVRDHKNVTLVFLGDLNWRYHKLDSLIRAIKILRERGVKLSLKIIGRGATLKSLVKLVKDLNIEDLVKFYGYLDYDKLMEEMGTSDIAIAGRPSADNLWIKTSMRLTIYEYLACGLPVLAYGPPNSYTEYFIRKYGVGLYVASDDPQIIADDLQKNLGRLLKISHEHVRNVAKKFDWSKIMTYFAESIINKVKVSV